MSYQLGGLIVFLFLLAIAVFSYLQSSRRAEALDRRRRRDEVRHEPHDSLHER